MKTIFSLGSLVTTPGALLVLGKHYTLPEDLLNRHMAGDLLWDAFDEGLPPNLDRSVFDLRPLIDSTVFNSAVCGYHDQPNQPWHHALHDARAYRAGWLAWMKVKKQGTSK